MTRRPGSPRPGYVALLVVALVAVTALLIVYGRGVATAQTTDVTRQDVHRLREHTQQIRHAKCRGRLVYTHRLVWSIPDSRVDDAYLAWQHRRRFEQRRFTNCPRALIRTVFPYAYERAALRVASCETVGFTDYYNERSGASGLFQLMPFHWRGKFDPFDKLRNARYALRLSDGGTDWSAWECQP